MNSQGFDEFKPLKLTISVWSSPCLDLSACTPMMPCAPGLLSMITACLSAALRPSAAIRAKVSVAEPAGLATMIVSGLLGQAHAVDSANTLAPGHAAMMPSAKIMRRLMR
ncbi:hypothetical protein CS347_08050 [Bordetella hinzii]|uniref:Uncharacterized protein n=1 Tax=Bordetella hinzii TaxID=103855 RepID=A0AAN1VFK7_9BORD|nr:hypothetical protein CS347_08050 [Bordetella hinzii]